MKGTNMYEEDKVGNGIKLPGVELEPGEKVFTNCAIGGAVFVHVKDGRITKVRPMIFGDEDTPA